MIQLQFINKLLSTGDSSLITLNNLTEDFFSDYKDEFSFIINHLRLYNKIPDRETFLNSFPKFDIINVNENDKYLLDALYEDKNRRFLIKTFNKMREYLNNGDTNAAINLYNNNIKELSESKYLESIDLFEDLSRYDSYVEKTQDFKKYYVKTGFPELDELIGGWDRKEELATIAARTNNGKSWILLKTAIAAAEQGLKVGIYSGEMSENKVGYRMDTLISHISNSKITRGDISIQSQYKKYLDNIKDNIKGTIKVLTPNMVSGVVGVNTLKAWIEKENLDMLCIDQHSLLEDDRKGKTPIERASNISRDLKQLQVLKKIPIIAVSQQNREKNDNGKPDTTNISQSDRIGQDSTIIIFFEQKEDTESNNKILTLYLTKSRDSINGKTLKYIVNFNEGIFTFIPNEDDALNGSKCEELKNEYEDIKYEENPF